MDEPPLAYPRRAHLASPPRSLASTPTSTPWSTPGTFTLSGSNAPRAVTSRRPPPRKGHSSRSDAIESHKPSQRSQTNSSPARASPPILYKDATCCCCATDVKYPRDSLAFRCTVCRVANDVAVEARWGLPGEPPSPAPVRPVSERDVVELASRFSSTPDRGDRVAPQTDEELARELQRVELSQAQAHAEDPEDLLVEYLSNSFASLEALDASFHPDPVPTTHLKPYRRTTVPSRATLSTFYRLVDQTQRTPLQKSLVSGLLERPGSRLSQLSGAWSISLLESPVFDGVHHIVPLERRLLQSRFYGLLSNLPNSHHHLLVQYLSAPTYPRDSLLGKVDSLCSFISWRIGQCLDRDEAYGVDWEIAAAAKVGSLFLAANANRSNPLPLSSFYVSMLDTLGEDALTADFLAWESGDDSTFSFCQYPFLISLGVKSHFLHFDGQRQMMDAAAAAHRSAFAGRGLESPLLVLEGRQILANKANLRKTIRIKFTDEEGIDAGGLRKEWFLLLCRQLFDPQFAMFRACPDSNLCWFNPGAFETEDYWLLGTVVGLAVYHMATLDVPLPLAAYKKLRGETVTLSDLAQFEPVLARSLQQLLDYAGGDVEDVFCRTFVGTYEAWGDVIEVELCDGGREIPVTNENREEYVRLLVEFLLNTSIAAQFEPFFDGFNQVCSGNALALFRGEELELIVRGSDEPLDVEQVRGITVYHGFSPHDQVIEHFWSIVSSWTPRQQRLLLLFITGSDRLPATGITALEIKISCLGRHDSDRLPTSATCFNELRLFRYEGGRDRLERLILQAIEESEGFGLR
ncbi:hypothetical protein JCM10212_006964 [Sporobolomyces blumeae]